MAILNQTRVVVNRISDGSEMKEYDVDTGRSKGNTVDSVSLPLEVPGRSG